jgi:hypothetical protein
LQMLLVLRLYHSLIHQTPAWILLKIQVSGFKNFFVSLNLFSQIRRVERSMGMVQNLEHENSALILAFTRTCNIFRRYGWVCQILCFEMTFGCILLLAFVVPPLCCILINICQLSCTCTTEQSSFSDADPDSGEHQVRSTSSMEELSY